MFLYAHVLGWPLRRLNGLVAVRQVPRVPIVLTGEEVRLILGQMSVAHGLVAVLLIHAHVLNRGGRGC